MTAINLNRTTEPAGVMAKPNVRIGHFKEGLSEEKRKPHHHITNKFALDMTRNQTHRELDNEMRERKTYLDSHTQKEIRSHTTEHHAHDEFMHDTTENKGHQTRSNQRTTRSHTQPSSYRDYHRPDSQRRHVSSTRREWADSRFSRRPRSIQLMKQCRYSNISGIPPIRVELTVSKHEDL